MGNFFILVSVVLNVIGQTALKSGVNKLGALSFSFGDIYKAFTSWLVLGGLGLYVVGSVFWILALSQKDLSYAYPMLSLGYILVIAISWAFLSETITPLRLVGVLFVSFGLFLVFKSA